MKTLGIIVAMLLISSIFAGAALAFPWNNIKIFDSSSGAEASDTIAVSTGISDVDVADSNKDLEMEVDKEFRGESVREVGFPVLWKGQGWVKAEDSRAAFANAVILEKKVTDVNGNIFSSIHGRLKVGEIKLKMTSMESTDERKVFTLSGGNNVEGTLTLTRSEKYDGLSIWNGEIMLKESGSSDDKLKGTIVLAMHETRVKPQIVAEVKERVETSYEAKFNLDALEFKAIASDKPEGGIINFLVYGSNKVEGKLRLNLAENTDTTRSYSGEISLEEVGDSDDRLDGNVKVSLTKADENVWKGTITLETKNGDVSKGNFYLFEERVVKKVSVEGGLKPKTAIKEDPTLRGDTSKKTGTKTFNSGSDNVNSEKAVSSGLWEKVRKFFSGSK